MADRRPTVGRPRRLRRFPRNDHAARPPRLITTQTPILEVAGDTAIGRTYLIEANARKGRAPVFPIGIYYDRFVRQDGRWRFHWHHYQSFYYGPIDLSGPFAERTDYGAPFGMPALDEPAPPSLAFEA